jgi:hypothetical protein
MGDMFAVGGCDCSCNSGTNCYTCVGDIGTTLSVTDALFATTATWNSTLGLFVTPDLCSASSTSPTATCSGGSASCYPFNHAAGAVYYYTVECIDATHMEIFRYWYELTCTGTETVEYAPCSCTPIGTLAYSSSGSVLVNCLFVNWSGTLTQRSGGLSDPADISLTVGFSSP